jgi:hypothetical protein
MRKAISITLQEDNLLWLRGQAAQTSRASVSEVLDRIVSQARTAGWVEAGAIRSVVGSIDLPDDDPDLAGADAHIRTMFAASVQRPMVLREPSARVRTGKQTRG